MVQKFNINDVLLSKGIKIIDYKKMVLEEDKKEIMNLINKRFQERFIIPLEFIDDSQIKSGFLIMAICCLMIESLESFYRGWEDTRGRRSPEAFKKFFARVDGLKQFKDVSDNFYKHIRCGILHQAETTGSWRIRRDINEVFGL